MSINGSETLFCGTVVAFLADTLAAHDIGGFKIGVSFALRKCRVCMATQDSIQSKVCLFVFCLTFIVFKYSLLSLLSHFGTKKVMIIIVRFWMAHLLKQTL